VISIQDLGIKFEEFPPKGGSFFAGREKVTYKGSLCASQPVYQKWIFRNLCLTVDPGQSVVLLGPSGSGKSLLLKLIAGLLTPSEGEVRLSSQNISMLFQRNALFDSLTVEENLLFPLREKHRGADQDRTFAYQKVNRLLEAVGLKGSEKNYPDEISGGMQKRLGIARALVIDPEIILYDEPTAGLDPITSKTIAQLIQNLRLQFKTTLVTVTNDIQRAYQMGDQIYLLARGRLIAGGNPKQVQDTSHPELKQFIYGLRQGPLTASESA
jgi:phospholipid/cholesterol/gamma-HCH transport system ATP-binding protein